MKKLSFLGLTVLMMFFSFGFAKVNGANTQDEHETEDITITVSPAPGDGTVPVGTEITITVTPAGADVYYDMYASLEDAKEGFPMSEVSSDGNPTVTVANPVLAVYVEAGDDEKTVYFEYMVSGSTDPDEPDEPDDPADDEATITVTVSPTPEDGAVSAGTEITITVTPAGADVYYDMYASLENAKDDFPMSEVSLDGNPTVTVAKPVLAVYVESGDDAKTVYFEYTVTGSTDPEEPDQPDAPTVNKTSGAYVAGTQITVSKGEADKLLVVTGKTAAAIAEATDFTEYTTDYTITLTQDTAIRAYTMKGELKSGDVSRAYTIKQTVSFAFDPAPGEVEENTEIKVTVTPAPMDIYFGMFANREEAEEESMLDYIYGEDEDGFPKVTKSKTVLKVIARFEDNSSEEGYAEYTIKGATPVKEKVQKPKFDVQSGVVEKGKMVEISCATPGAKIYYTVNDGDPTVESTLYTDEIRIDSNMTIKAIAIKEGWENSEIETAVYALQGETPEEVPAPVFTPDAGAVDANSTVTILKGTADSIFVAFGKSLDFAKYTADVTVTIVSDTTIRAYAMKNGDMSQTVTKKYTLKPASETADTVKTPTFSPLAGQVEKGTKVTITTATEGATIHYTVDGSEPAVESPEYTAEIEINADMTIKAIAVKEGMENSLVAESSYTVKPVSNEDRELAGVRLYPNPTSGEFNLTMPAAGEVEIFSAEGKMVKHLFVGEGTVKVRLDDNGIYFVRVRANGQVAIKKVIVR